MKNDPDNHVIFSTFNDPPLPEPDPESWWPALLTAAASVAGFIGLAVIAYLKG